jgi:hypothetical protein
MKIWEIINPFKQADVKMRSKEEKPNPKTSTMGGITTHLSIIILNIFLLNYPIKKTQTSRLD